MGGAVLAAAHGAKSPTDALAAGFMRPPQDARPLVFWQWVNGNVSEAGIRLDLEWMQRVGIGGALMFDIGFASPPVPQYVEHRVGFGSREWEAAVRVAASEAKRLGLALGAQSGGGWSVTGGPLVAPEQAMKKLVWSETVVTAHTPATLRLPQPPGNSGPYQDVPISGNFKDPSRYADVAVIGFRLPEGERATQPGFSGISNSAALGDQRYSSSVELTPSADGTAALLARLEEGATPLAVTLAVPGKLPKGAIEASADGINFVSVVELPGNAPRPAPVNTFALPERVERIWRIRFRGLTGPLAIAEARFEFGARVDRAAEKAGYGVLADPTSIETTPRRGTTVDPREILDLSAHFSPDGSLSWRPPDGSWIVTRFGWSLTGRRAVPATPESIGLEVDKLDAAAVRAFAAAHYDRYPRGSIGIALTDSWEAGQQNWTPAMFEEFSARRGYDLRPWLPVLTGRVVGDVARSERFLADFRLTVADLLADNHYGVLAQVARERGMKSYSEAAGTDLPTVIDGLKAKGRVDVPMGEYWFYPADGQPKPGYVADVREAASAAHTYGLHIVAAEALTSRGEEPWATGPTQLRRIADRFFAEGINRVVLHTAVHQPFTDRRPGITLRQYGQHFTRNETWAEDAGAWVAYLARTSYLLQQGKPVADVAIFLGEDAPVSPSTQTGGLQRLDGYDHDFINAEVLLTRMTVRAGRLTLPDGMSYRLISIPRQVRRLSLAVVEKLYKLVAAGAVLVGPKPLGAAGLGDSDERVLAIADRIWGGKPLTGVRKLGRGRVYVATEVLEALRNERIEPDVAASGSERLQWVHRKTVDADIYFVSNQSSAAFSEAVRLRTHGRRARFWDAVDGSTAAIDHSIDSRTTTVRIELAPFSSGFIVLRGRSAPGRFAVAQRERRTLAQLEGPWDVEFLDGQGAPATTRLASGVSWADSTDPAVRYYSGRAKYSRTVTVPPEWLAAGRRVELELGSVGELAHIRVNDRDLGVNWNAPFRHDITAALRAGENRLEVVVTNYWVNRLIGDEQPGATRFTFASIHPYTAASALRPSGLLGAVRLLGSEAGP